MKEQYFKCFACKKLTNKKYSKEINIEDNNILVCPKCLQKANNHFKQNKEINYQAIFKNLKIKK